MQDYGWSQIERRQSDLYGQCDGGGLRLGGKKHGNGVGQDDDEAAAVLHGAGSGKNVVRAVLRVKA